MVPQSAPLFQTVGSVCVVLVALLVWVCDALFQTASRDAEMGWWAVWCAVHFVFVCNEAARWFCQAPWMVWVSWCLLVVSIALGCVFGIVSFQAQSEQFKWSRRVFAECGLGVVVVVVDGMALLLWGF